MMMRHGPIMTETAFESLPLHSVGAHPYRARNRGCACPRRIKHRHEHRPGLCDICRCDRRPQLVTTNEGRYEQGTVPTHRRVMTKVVAVDCQYEPIASSDRGGGRNGGDQNGGWQTPQDEQTSVTDMISTQRRDDPSRVGEFRRRARRICASS